MNSDSTNTTSGHRNQTHQVLPLGIVPTQHAHIHACTCTVEHGKPAQIVNVPMMLEMSLVGADGEMAATTRSAFTHPPS